MDGSHAASGTGGSHAASGTGGSHAASGTEGSHAASGASRTLAGSRFSEARAALRRHWGHPDFRPAQQPVVEAMLAGRDVLAVLPTGGGKSVCFQVPALLAAGLTLVVSPLISLMEDQVAAAGRRGIKAAALTSATPPGARAGAEEALAAGRLKLLYASPERLSVPAFRAALARANVCRIAVDEAHCISEWGHDFRPSYRRIAEARRALGDPPVAAFTATATPRTRADIEASLALREAARLVHPVDRPNLRWAAGRAISLEAGARRVLAAVRGCPGAAIVYVATRGRTVRAAVALRRLGLAAAPYHAGMDPQARREVQEAFLDERLRVVCATSAFGMGIDHPCVRLVAHLGLPGSLEAYVQEAGRAGRDGEPARCLLVGCPGDLRLQKAFVLRAWPSGRALARVWNAAPPARPVTARALRAAGCKVEEEMVEAAFRLLVEFGCARASPEGDGGPAVIRGPDALRRRIDFGAPRRGRRRGLERLRALRRYLDARTCRRAAIAAYFGEAPPACAGCDRCGPSGITGSTRGRSPGGRAPRPGTSAAGPGSGRSDRRARHDGPGRSEPSRRE